MSNDLIKKAWEDYKGVWPYSEKDAMTVCVKDYILHRKGQYTIAIAHKEFYMTNGYIKWVGTKADFEAYGERLKAEQWTPEVGQPCEVYWWGDWQRAFIIGLNEDGNLVCEVDDSVDKSRFQVACNSTKFRPLKTESEKQADAMFDIVKDATDLYHACELLVKEGYSK